MVYFKDLERNGRSYLCVVNDPSINAADATHTFPIQPSMLRGAKPNLSELRRQLPGELTRRDEAQNGSAYVLKSFLPDKEKSSGTEGPPMLGRRIIRGTARWGDNSLKISGECTYLPGYWTWTEVVLVRLATRLKDAKLYDAVYASLFTYDRDPNVMRAFCESWCPQTNTLHTIAGEWSISLWDLHKIGGLPISGHPYDEAIPSIEVLTSRHSDGNRRIPRVVERLFDVYCKLVIIMVARKGFVLLIGFSSGFVVRTTTRSHLPEARGQTILHPTVTTQLESSLQNYQIGQKKSLRCSLNLELWMMQRREQYTWRLFCLVG